MELHPVSSTLEEHPPQFRPPKLVKIIFVVAFLVFAPLLSYYFCTSIFFLQFLHRLREVSIFLVVTAAIALTIFNSPRVNLDQKKFASVDEFHLSASIFGETDLDYYIKKSEVAAQTQRSSANVAEIQDAWSNAAHSSPNSAEAVTFDVGRFHTRHADNRPTHRRNLSASRDVGDPRGAVTQRKLHRKSSSLDDGVDYEPPPQADAVKCPQIADQVPPRSSLSSARMSANIAHSKPEGGKIVAPRAVGVPKKVRFLVDEGGDHARKPQEDKKSVTSSSLPPFPATIAGSSPLEFPPNASNGESTSQVRSPVSPNELNRQADAFIAKFKEQIRLQKLESFQRYRRSFS